MTTSVAIPDVIAERTAINTYTVHNGSGAELRIGTLGAEGAFSPAVASAKRIIDKLCTVRRSLSAGVEPVSAVTHLESAM